ncbi:hypothetical protein OnM2_076047 [Erysiphe neolycopersici]|uniref:Uncharacterized protein n=1 Tax=Erysiphe neolycopersici TaxID=212602 RepID=A0A420HI74_9PEZI|nr:hypothetical protein OnM2_076047 [Erysiphe neolycopersici]
MTVHGSKMQSKRDTHRNGWNPPKLNDLSHVLRCPAFINVLTNKVSKQVANEHISALRDPRKAFSTKDSLSSSPTLGNASDTYLRFLSKIYHPSNASARFQYTSEDIAIASGIPLVEKEYASWILHTDPYMSKTEIEEQTKFPFEEDLDELNDRFDNLVRSWLRESQKQSPHYDSKETLEDQEIDILDEYHSSLMKFHRLREQGIFCGSFDAQHLDGLRSNPTRGYSSVKKVSATKSYSRVEFLQAVKHAARMQDRERSMIAARRKKKLENDQFLSTEEYRIKFTSIMCSLLVNFKLQGYTWEENSMSLCLKLHDKTKLSDGEEVKFVGFLKNHLESRKGSDRLFYDTVVARLIDQGIYPYYYMQPESGQWTTREMMLNVGKINARKKSIDTKLFAYENRSMMDLAAIQVVEELRALPVSYKLTRGDMLNLIVEVTTRIELDEWHDESQFEESDELI